MAAESLTLDTFIKKFSSFLRCSFHFFSLSQASISCTWQLATLSTTCGLPAWSIGCMRAGRSHGTIAGLCQAKVAALRTVTAAVSKLFTVRRSAELLARLKQFVEKLMCPRDSQASTLSFSIHCHSFTLLSPVSKLDDLSF